jgi:hypothetical protein
LDEIRLGNRQPWNNQLGNKKVATTPLRVMATFAHRTPALPVRVPVENPVQVCCG